MKNEELMNAIGNVDDDLLREMDALRGIAPADRGANEAGEDEPKENGIALRKPHGPGRQSTFRKWLTPLAACLLLMIGGLTAYAVTRSGGFLSVGKGGTSEDPLQTYQFSLTEAVKIPSEEIKGEIQNLTELFEEDFKGFIVPLDRSFGSHEDRFDTLEDAESFVGYDNLHLIRMTDQPDHVSIETFGEPFLTNPEDQKEREKTAEYQRWMEAKDEDNWGLLLGEDKKGKVDSVELLYKSQQCPYGLTGKDFYAALTMIWITAPYYVDDNHLAYQSSAVLFTEYYADEIGIRGASFDEVVHEGKNMVVNGREFIILESEGFQSGMVNREVFWQEGNVLYVFSCRYMPDQQARVDELTLEWMNGF